MSESGAISRVNKVAVGLVTNHKKLRIDNPNV